MIEGNTYDNDVIEPWPDAPPVQKAAPSVQKDSVPERKAKAAPKPAPRETKAG